MQAGGIPCGVGIRQVCDICKMPEVFEDITVDSVAPLEDVLVGGLYGVNDLNRARYFGRKNPAGR